MDLLLLIGGSGPLNVDPTPGTMQAFMTTVTTFLSSILTMVASIISTITGNDYLMIGLCIVIVSFAVGLVVRLVSKLGHAAR